jgi:exo-beta-1,3-glucanase (GH17 family)
MQQYGHDWIIAVSVGSEDLYRGETDASTLAAQINDVRGMMWGLGAGSIEVGHVDTWTAWVDSANTAVIEACDFLGMDGYPYFQDASIQDANDVFWTSVDKVRSVSQGRWVWLTESGWPVSGGNLGAAAPSVENAQTYWWQVMCETCKSRNRLKTIQGTSINVSTVREMHSFAYTLQDYTSSPSFGVVDNNFNPLYDLSC